MLNDDQVLIRDEIAFDRAAGKIRWGMMTDASVELLGNKAVLTKNGKKFFLQAYSDQDVTFAFEAAKAYHKEAKDNTGKSLLFFELNENGEKDQVNFSVVLGRNMHGLNEVIVNSSLDAW
jgi:hypothetical protein